MKLSLNKVSNTSSITAVLPLKGDDDLYRFNNLLKPSLLKIHDLNLIVISDERINPSRRISVIKDNEIFIPKDVKLYKRGWIKQQIIKIEISKYVKTKWYLTLDADCFFLFKGGVDNFFKNNKPLVNITNDIKNPEWWVNASKSLNVELPKNTFCAVTPMILKTDLCKELSDNYDLEDLIFKKKCTEYTLYWLYGKKIGIKWEDVYTFEKLLSVASWHAEKNYKKTIEKFKLEYMKVKDLHPLIGLFQSRLNKKNLLNVETKKVLSDIREIIQK